MQNVKIIQEITQWYLFEVFDSKSLMKKKSKSIMKKNQNHFFQINIISQSSASHNADTTKQFSHIYW